MIGRNFVVFGLYLLWGFQVVVASKENLTPGKIFTWWDKKLTAEQSTTPSETHITLSLHSHQAGEYIRNLADEFEMMVLFKIPSKMSSSAMKHPFISQALSHAKNKHILDYIYPSSVTNVIAKEESLTSVFQHEEFFSKENHHKFSSMKEFTTFLQKNNHEEDKKKRFLTNDQLEYLEVTVDKEEDVQMMEEVSELPAVLFFTYDDNTQLFKHSQPLQTSPHAFTTTAIDEFSRVLSSSGSSDLADGKSYKPEGSEYAIYYQDTYLYITPDIFTGAMTGLFFFFVFYIGISCLGAIQGNVYFYDKVPSLGKEA